MSKRMSDRKCIERMSDRKYNEMRRCGSLPSHGSSGHQFHRIDMRG